MSEKKDPVAEKSKFLCMYMSNHPDTLVAYVRYFGRIKETVSSAQMIAIDTTVRVFLRLYMRYWFDGGGANLDGYCRA